MIKVKRCIRKSKEKLKNIHKKGDTRSDLNCLFPGSDSRKRGLLTVYIRIKLHMDLQADKSPVVVKGPFFPRVVNPRYRICGTTCNARIQSSKAKKTPFEEPSLHLI
jgi:hypothetical protein